MALKGWVLRKVNGTAQLALAVTPTRRAAARLARRAGREPSSAAAGGQTCASVTHLGPYAR